LRESLPKDVKSVLEQVAKAGFKEVETYGYTIKEGFFGTTPKDFKNILNDNGLKAPSGHYDFSALMKDNNYDFLKASIETASILGSEYIVVPWFAPELRGTSADDYKKIAQKINKAGVLCKEAGLKIAYHNHDFEFEKFENTTGFEVLLNETDKKLVDFELDLYWVVRAGYDPLQLFKENSGRFTMWHVKDMEKTKPEWNTEIGNGRIDFKAIFAQAKVSGMKHFYVEQETNYTPNPIESVKTSFNYIEKYLM
jgi:sugar phosphate isomerase/epimerase